ARAAGERAAAGGHRGEDPRRGDARGRQGAGVGRLVGRRRRADARRQGADRHPKFAAPAATQVITPRRTRLVRVPDLKQFRRAIANLALGDSPAPSAASESIAASTATAENAKTAETAQKLTSPDSESGTRTDEPRTRTPEPRTRTAEPRTRTAEPRTRTAEPRTRTVEPRTRTVEPRTPNAERRTPNPLLVAPTPSAARQLTRDLGPVDGVTRDEMYDRLHARLESPPRRLTALERDVMAQAAARSAAARAGELTFQLRPGLIAEMLRFYDQLRRQSQQVKRFEELIEDALGSEDLDRAARRMRIQTRFLAGAFREYERLVAASSGCDEHTLRDRLSAQPARDPVAHIVVTVADWIAESEGLFVADFDLLTRIPGLATLEIIATENVLASGFDERLHEWWPGIEDTRFDGRRSDSAIPDAAPVRSTLVVPGLPRTMHPESPLPNPESRPANTDLWWTYRDREEELMAVARQIT